MASQLAEGCNGIKLLRSGSRSLLAASQTGEHHQVLIRLTTEPRPITARGELAADETATIELFERSSPSVVFITTRQRVLNPWTRDIFSVERGSGSGLI